MSELPKAISEAGIAYALASKVKEGSILLVAKPWSHYSYGSINRVFKDPKSGELFIIGKDEEFPLRYLLLGSDVKGQQCQPYIYGHYLIEE